jgi:uncharacterized protein
MLQPTDANSQPVESPPAPARRPGWHRGAVRVLRSVLFIYLGVILVLYAMQTWLIFPGHSTQGQPMSVVRPSPDHELIELTTRTGDRIVAIFGRAITPEGEPLADASSRPTILFFYGNGMCMADAMGEFRKFRKLGANVMIPDFAGYGMSGGKPSEQTFYATGDACWEHLLSRKDIDHRLIVPTGWSLGAAVAIDLAARYPVAGLATFSAFTSMGDMAGGLLPWLPTSLLIRHRFESERKIREIDVPTLIVHGRGDQIIPHAMSERLARAAKGKVTWLSVQTDHNDLFDMGSGEILAAFGQFLQDLNPRRLN